MLVKLSWLLAALSVIGTVADTIVVAVSFGLLSETSLGFHGWPLVNIAALGSSVLGAVIVSKYPRHPIGWLLNVIGISSVISLLAESYGLWVGDHNGPGSDLAGDVASLLAAVLGGPLALSALTIVFLLVPDGRFLSTRWRNVGITAAAAYICFASGILLVGPDGATLRGETTNHNIVADVLSTVGFLTTVVTLVAAVVAMVIRLRRSTGDARQQLRIIAFGAAAVGVALVWLIIAQTIISHDQTWWSSVPLFAAYAVLVFCIALAVLRYRLYDLDLVISKAVVLTVATAFVAVGYVAVVVVVSLAMGSRAEGFWLSLLATVVVAMAFQPLRRWVVRLADRLAFGIRAVPYDELAEFSRRLGQSPAPESLLPAVAEAVARATQARRTIVVFDLGKGLSRQQTWPPGSEAAISSGDAFDMVVPVVDRTGELGRISIQLPSDHELRPQEVRLVEDIAEQAGLAFRNTRLEVELAAHVEALDRQTEELAASRRRIIEAADAERQRVEAAISRDVLPTLLDVQSALELSRDSAVEAVATGRLIDAATHALESLRDLTRGIYPTMLTRSGLAPALTSYFTRVGLSGALDVEESAAGKRFPPRVEAAAYYCCVEAVSGASGAIRATLGTLDGVLTLEVAGADLDRMDQQAIADRVAVCGGAFTIDAELAREAVLNVVLPIEAPDAQSLAVAAVHS